MNITSQLQAVKKLIADAEHRYQREPGSVFLLAVSKKQPIEKMREVFAAGQIAFGESYLQEALLKMAADPSLAAQIEWHFIGPIQSNKTRKIAQHFVWVHSVDSLKIAKRLNEQRPPTLPPLNICIEVNISGEQNKSGVAPADLLALATYCQTLPRLRLRGLMTIPAATPQLAAQRQAFQQLHTLWQSLRAQNFELDTLSMGMSEDFEAAIAEGSTCVRIGSAIFGLR
jgi:pyridoxal phosphate enzyme (YggS family)